MKFQELIVDGGRIDKEDISYRFCHIYRIQCFIIHTSDNYGTKMNKMIARYIHQIVVRAEITLRK